MQPATSSWWSTGKNAPKSSDTEKNPDVHRLLYYLDPIIYIHVHVGVHRLYAQNMIPGSGFRMQNDSILACTL